jgi:hypothetical protein
MGTARLDINNNLLSKMLKILIHINSEVRILFSNIIEIRAMDPSRSHYLSVKLNKEAYKDYKKSEDFEILSDIVILKQVSEKSGMRDVALYFSDSKIKFNEEGPMGSVFELNIYSTEKSSVNEPKFLVKNKVNSDSTQILEGLKKLSIISEFYDIINRNNKVLFHSQEQAYGDGVFIVGEAEGFSSKTDFYRISPLKEVLEIVPDNTPIVIEMGEQHILKITFSFSKLSFSIFIAASASEK